MENIILIEKDKNKQFNSIKELYKYIFGDAYFKLKKSQKFIKRYELAFYILNFNSMNLDIVHTKMGVIGEKYTIKNTNYNLESSFIIDNELLFLLSLCKINYYYLLEKKDFDEILSKEEKQKYKGNYIIINDIVDELILKNIEENGENNEKI